MSEITVTAANFEAEVLNSELPVLLDFWATWCGPCKMIAPYVAEIAAAYAGRIKVGKVNVDEEPQLAMQFRITAIPTLIIFKDGKIVGENVGYLSQQKLEAMVDRAL